MKTSVRYLAAWLLAVAVFPVAPTTHAQEKPTARKAEKPVVAVFRLKGSITETPAGEEFLFATGSSTSLKDLVARLKKAKDDKNVQAIVLTLEGASLGSAQAEELRQAMAQLRLAGKEIYAHADSLETGDYTLLSGATHLSMVPTGDLWLIGLYGESPYVNGLLKKLGVKPDFLTCGEFKSAAEMFMREGPSPQAEKMQNWLLDGMFETQVRLIAEGRNVSQEKVRSWIDAGPYSAAGAKQAGLIDAVEHRQDFVATLKEKYGDDVRFDAKYGAKKSSQPDFSSPLAAFQLWSELLSGPKKKVHKTSVAIVYVDGPISLGSAESSLFGAAAGAYSTNIRKALEEAAKDDTIKAVVLRVDSPGGSATASEIILDATKRVKAKKPLVVSMGNVAGSGGYYVACGSDTIYADESTITGSIGVVGGKLATTEMWNKVGVTWKGYQRGANAGLLSSAGAFNEPERKRMQAWMDEVYGVFKGHVTAIRGDRLKKDIDELAGGRVYTGKQALELGLVDKIGTLNDAIGHIAKEAKLSDYEVRVVPEPKGFLELLLEDSSGGKSDDSTVLLDAAASLDVRPSALAREATMLDAAMPLLKGLDPHRMRAVLTSLRQLETLRQEGVVLMTPEFVIQKK